MRVKSCACLSAAWMLACALTATAADDAQSKLTQLTADADFTAHVAPLLTKYCSKCHSGQKPKGNLALDKFKSASEFLANATIPDKVAQFVRGKEMPPGNRPQPSKDEVAQLLKWIDTNLGSAGCKGINDPGTVTMRRLNRVEYNNTIRDLVGVHFQPADDFPADDVGYGFDNIGDVLSLPTLLMEKYLAAAEKITAEALKTPELKSRIFTTKPDSKTTEEQAAKKIIENFARQAFRRNVTPAEVDRLATFVALAKTNGDSFDKGIELALQAILTSPHFLFRIERSKRPNNPEIALPISEFELATRLSYFLWSSMPDAELLRDARQDKLRKNLEAQVRRMLKSPKSQALVENFGGQWLNLRNLKTVQPDPGRFPQFNDELRQAMEKETELFFAAIMNEDRSILDLLDADFTFVNEPLAKLYGIPGITDKEFQRVKLTHTERGGVLTQASVLTITSNPTRTSPVKRGKWILENILNAPPPPPPPDVPDLAEEGAALTGSMRQRMEQHRANPNCAVCHQRMDPLGFGFENFDAIGAWREKDGAFPIDPSGQLPGGESFRGPAELRQILKSRQPEFCRCLTEKMLTYAVGRGIQPADRCVIDRIVEALTKDGNRFQTLVMQIVKSDPFQKRRGQ
jgi:mono/diheme cytochrome c family protein